MFDKIQKTNNKIQKTGRIFDIKKRTYNFARRILDIAEKLPRGIVTDVVVRQLVRSGTSIGANIEEANGSLTKPDFRNRAVIARKEACETRYWLRLISEKYLSRDELNSDIFECEEYLRIFSAMIKKRN